MAVAYSLTRVGDEFRQLAEALAREHLDERATLERLAADRRLGAAAARSRLQLAAAIEAELGPFDPAHLAAVRDVARERFVRPADIARALDDTPLPLDDAGLSTISAPHAYLLSFRLLRLREGDDLVELGSGSGYGAALAANIVGPTGSVTTFEIDPTLAARAARLVAAPNVHVHRMDASDSAPAWGRAKKVAVTFAVRPLPEEWTRALRVGGVLVAPVGPRDRDQRLVRVERVASGDLVSTDHGGVRYVPNRSARSWN